MIIDAGLCTIRSWRPGDEAALAHHANNRAIWQNLRDRFPHPYTPDDARQWVALATHQEPETNWVIDVKGEFVGCIGLILHDDIECSAEIGYWLGESYWGQGIATAALRAVTDYAFAQFDLNRIYAVPFTHNRASARTLEKAGYQYEGTMRKSVIKDGVMLDQLLYACVR